MDQSRAANDPSVQPDFLIMSRGVVLTLTAGMLLAAISFASLSGTGKCYA